MLTAVKTWLLEATWGVPHWTAALMLLFVVLSRLFAKSSRPEFRHVLGWAAMGIRWVLLTTRIGLIPVLGTTIVRALEVLAGVDIDGDGKIGDDPPERPRMPGALMLALLAIWMAVPMGCAWTKRTVRDVGKCGMDAAKEADFLGAVRRILADPRQHVAFQELEKLVAEYTLDFVDCMVQRVLDGDAGSVGATSEGVIIQSNGNAWLAR